MSDFIFGSALLLSSFVGIIIFFKTLKRRKQNESAVWLLLLDISALLWTFTYALFYLMPKGDMALLFIDIRYLFVMTSGWLAYLLIYQTLNHRMFLKRTLLLFSLFPIIDLFIVLTNRYTGFLINYSGFIEVNGIRALEETKNVGFIYHCVVSYIPFLLGAFMIARRLLHLPKKEKKQMCLLILGMLIIFTMTLLAVLNLLPYPIDLAPLGSHFMLAVFYYAMFNLKSMDMMFISRDFIFENASSVILILDTDGTIVDYNKQALKMSKLACIDDMIGMHSDQFVKMWQDSSHCHIFEEDPSIFTMVKNQTDRHHQIQVSEMTGKRGDLIGFYMEIKDISPIMSRVHMLQDFAYYDDLTGLPNRNFFQKKLAQIDRPESLPLCVMVGDINGLKTINDTYGHVKGDVLLKRMSSILLRHAPDDALFFRMGGDEFVGLFPRTTAEQSQGFIQKIENFSSQIDDPDLKYASITLGFKIKTSLDERIEDMIKAADSEMYATKRNRRQSASIPDQEKADRK